MCTLPLAVDGIKSVFVPFYATQTFAWQIESLVLERISVPSSRTFEKKIWLSYKSLLCYLTLDCKSIDKGR